MASSPFPVLVLLCFWRWCHGAHAPVACSFAQVRELIAKEARTGVKKDKRRAAAMLRVKKGLAKAKVVGGNAGAAAHHIKAQRRRYGRLRKGQAAGGGGAQGAVGAQAVGDEAGLEALGLW